MSDIISAFKKKYSTNSVLMKLTEDWNKNLDKKKYVVAVLMDLSKVFDCVPHGNLVAKTESETLTLFFTYLNKDYKG